MGLFSSCLPSRLTRQSTKNHKQRATPISDEVERPRASPSCLDSPVQPDSQNWPPLLRSFTVNAQNGLECALTVHECDDTAETRPSREASASSPLSANDQQEANSLSKAMLEDRKLELRNGMFVNTSPAIMTIFSHEGLVLHQNPQSIAYFGDVATSGYNSPVDTLEMLFSLNPDKYQRMLEEIDRSGGLWMAVLRVPQTLSKPTSETAAGGDAVASRLSDNGADQGPCRPRGLTGVPMASMSACDLAWSIGGTEGPQRQYNSLEKQPCTGTGYGHISSFNVASVSNALRGRSMGLPSSQTHAVSHSRIGSLLLSGNSLEHVTAGGSAAHDPLATSTFSTLADVHLLPQTVSAAPPARSSPVVEVPSKPQAVPPGLAAESVPSSSSSDSAGSGRGPRRTASCLNLMAVEAQAAHSTAPMAGNGEPGRFNSGSNAVAGHRSRALAFALSLGTSPLATAGSPNISSSCRRTIRSGTRPLTTSNIQRHVFQGGDVHSLDYPQPSSGLGSRPVNPALVSPVVPRLVCYSTSDVAASDGGGGGGRTLRDAVLVHRTASMAAASSSHWPRSQSARGGVARCTGNVLVGSLSLEHGGGAYCTSVDNEYIALQRKGLAPVVAYHMKRTAGVQWAPATGSIAEGRNDSGIDTVSSTVASRAEAKKATSGRVQCNVPRSFRVTRNHLSSSPAASSWRTQAIDVGQESLASMMAGSGPPAAAQATASGTFRTIRFSAGVALENLVLSKRRIPVTGKEEQGVLPQPTAAASLSGDQFCKATHNTNRRVTAMVSATAAGWYAPHAMAAGTPAAGETNGAAAAGVAHDVREDGTAEVSSACGKDCQDPSATPSDPECWHEVWAKAARDPVTGADVIMITQMDVTAKVVAERHLALVMETEHRLVEQLFPRHVLQYITEEWTAGEVPPTAEHRVEGGRHGDKITGGSLRWRPVIRDCNMLATWHPEVTLLFADIKGFTPMCKEMEPRQVMTLLNSLYSRYDAMLDEYGVYKVETIGDCYFVAGGLIHEDEDGMAAVRDECSNEDPLHAERVFSFAKAMLSAAREVVMPTTGQPVEIRIGLHTGPVVSGVVGTRMPRFCVFGDTVNTASRMESTGVPGAIHASEDTFTRLARRGGWKATGGIEVKGKGLMQTYIWTPPGPTDGGPSCTSLAGGHCDFQAKDSGDGNPSNSTSLELSHLRLELTDVPIPSEEGNTRAAGSVGIAMAVSGVLNGIKSSNRDNRETSNRMPQPVDLSFSGFVPIYQSDGSQKGCQPPPPATCHQHSQPGQQGQQQV